MATASSSSSSSPVLYAAHRRRLSDVDSDGGHCGHGAGAVGVKALFSVRRNNKRASMVDHAWMRNAVTCLLCLAVVVGLLSSHRCGSAGGRLVQKVDVGDGEVLGWREENLTAVARRPPDPPMEQERRYLQLEAKFCTQLAALGTVTRLWRRNEMGSMTPW